MAKSSTTFFCTECGNEFSKWSGQCPYCKAWNTITEALKEPKNTKTRIKNLLEDGINTRKFSTNNLPKTIKEIETNKDERIETGFLEFDRVLGGGIVAGSLVLVGGDPGIGKSTLILQMCEKISSREEKVLYVSGEESLRQIKLRANRIGEFSENMKVFCETNLDVIVEFVKEEKPKVLIVDSIQTMFVESSDSTPGSPSQVKEATHLLMQLAKTMNIATFIIGHVTKEGVVAGPRMLEHMVDTVCYLEGEKTANYRILRSVKNRFGATNEIGIFEMTSLGMEEVLNPSAYMLSGRAIDAPGSVITCLIEGTRPIMIEVQALVLQSNFGIPRRTASGCDYNRINLLMAVMEKRTNIHMGNLDAYVNIAGGMKANEPALDLSIIMALASSYKNKEIDVDTICFGEVGLSGEVRAVTNTLKRVKEAKKLNFKRCILPNVCKKDVSQIKDIELLFVSTIKEAINLL